MCKNCMRLTKEYVTETDMAKAGTVPESNRQENHRVSQNI